MSTELTTEELNNQIRYVSHEIRNHLSICDMYTQIVKKNLEKLEINNQSIDNAINCIQNSVQIIGANLLDLKSLNNLTLQVFDFKNTIFKSVELAKAYIFDKDINIEVFVKNTANIEIDENKFISCLVNILKNAIEAIENKGHIEILAEIKDNYGIIKISNNGKPISKDKQETIFDIGFTTKKNGCGLGLALCKAQLQAQSSTLELVCSNSTQTKFEIKVPVYK
jgi:signal transduction histidine kinase